MNCNQVGCAEPAVYRYRWPGAQEKTICEAHSVQARSVATAMGFSLELRPIEGALDFARLRDANVPRCEQAFHGVDAWSLERWALAMIGEAGEVCNAVKKIIRNDGSGSVPALAQEIADVVIYADLLAARAGIDLGEAVRAKFNQVSRARGSAILL